MTATTDHLAAVRAALAVNPSHLLAPSIAALADECERLRGAGATEDLLLGRVAELTQVRDELTAKHDTRGRLLSDQDARIATLEAELAAARAVPPDVHGAMLDVEAAADRRSGFVAACNRLSVAIARDKAAAGEAAVGYFIDGHAKRLCEQAGEHWTGDGEQLDAWAAKVHDVLNHLRGGENGAVIDGRAPRVATVGELTADTITSGQLGDLLTDEAMHVRHAASCALYCADLVCRASERARCAAIINERQAASRGPIGEG